MAAVLAGIAPCFVQGCKPENTNLPPVASAGDDIVAHVRTERAPDGSLVDQFDPVTLDASASHDPDGGVIVQYFWSFDTIPVGSALTYDAFSPNADVSSSTVFTPDQEGTYGIMLEVFDGQRLSSRDYVQVHVVRDNTAPTAVAGDDVNGVVGQPVTLDGSASADPDGDFLSFHWTLALTPQESGLTSEDIVYPRTAYPKITPDVPGVYALALEVDDGFGGTDTDLATLTVAEGNQPPVADAGKSRTITPCHTQPTTLDGSSSYDPDGDPLSYEWSVAEVPYGSLVNDTSFSSPDQPVTQIDLDRHGLYVFVLAVDDGRHTPATDVAAILFDDGSSEVPPVAHAGGNQQYQMTSACDEAGCLPCTFQVLLDGTGSYDLNDDPLSYAWEVSGDEGTLTDPNSATPELVVTTAAPAGSGSLALLSVEVQLVVSDCAAESAPSTAVLTFLCEGA